MHTVPPIFCIDIIGKSRSGWKRDQCASGLGTVEKVGVDEFDQWKFMNWGGTLKRVFELGGVMNKGIEANTPKLEDSLEGATPLQIFKY